MTRAQAPLLVGVNVLLVEDDEQVATVLSRLLTAHGANVRAATSGATALDDIRASSRWMEVLLCDFNLPGMNGLDVVKAALECVPSIAAILMTGDDDPAVAAKMIDIGGFGYMAKPMRTTELVTTIHNAAHRRDLALATQASTARREVSLLSLIHI